MLCPGCGALSPEGTRFCFNCGRLLPGECSCDTGQPLDRVAAMPWWLVLLLDVLTLGLYGPAWFLRRLGDFNALSSNRRLHPGLLWTALLGRTATLALGAAEALGFRGLPLFHGLESYLGAFIFVLMAHQTLRLRAMFKDHLLATSGQTFAAGWLWAVLFQELAAQRFLNRLKRCA